MKLVGSCHCQSVTFNLESHTPYPFLRCYCSICRKTAGGGGYAINIMGLAGSLRIQGEDSISIYQAILSRTQDGRPNKISKGKRHFCKHCGSSLWMSDSRWPKLIHPFASAIDTDLPIPKEHVHICLAYAANWCEIPKGEHEHHFAEFNDESIEDWHKNHHLSKK